MQLGNIEIVAAVLKAEYLGTSYLPKSDVDYFVFKIHEEAPLVLLRLLKSPWDDGKGIRNLLLKYFRRALNDLRKKKRTELKYQVPSENAQFFIDNYPCEEREYEEEVKEKTREVLIEALMQAPQDVRDLCLAYIRYKEWEKAGTSLKWHPYKTWRVTAKAKKFFRKFYTYRAGLLKLIPCKE